MGRKANPRGDKARIEVRRTEAGEGNSLADPPLSRWREPRGVLQKDIDANR